MCAYLQLQFSWNFFFRECLAATVREKNHPHVQCTNYCICWSRFAQKAHMMMMMNGLLTLYTLFMIIKEILQWKKKPREVYNREFSLLTTAASVLCEGCRWKMMNKSRVKSNTEQEENSLIIKHSTKAPIFIRDDLWRDSLCVSFVAM